MSAAMIAVVVAAVVEVVVVQILSLGGSRSPRCDKGGYRDPTETRTTSMVGGVLSMIRFTGPLSRRKLAS